MKSLMLRWLNSWKIPFLGIKCTMTLLILSKVFLIRTKIMLTIGRVVGSPFMAFKNDFLRSIGLLVTLVALDKLSMFWTE
jgi:hypothetical protein